MNQSPGQNSFKFFLGITVIGAVGNLEGLIRFFILESH